MLSAYFGLLFCTLYNNNVRADEAINRKEINKKRTEEANVESNTKITLPRIAELESNWTSKINLASEQRDPDAIVQKIAQAAHEPLKFLRHR